MVDRNELMLDAALEVIETMRVLKKSETDLVKEVLAGQEFKQWVHYPDGGVYDPESRSQYYFHAHDGSRDEWKDFGHFHTFIRSPQLDPAVLPVDTGTDCLPTDQVTPATHLIAISLNNFGMPVRLFTTNRWVTAETLYSAEAVIRMLDDFEIDLAKPSWPLNRWITAMLVLFRHDIEDLLRERDVRFAQLAMDDHEQNIYEDRSVAVISFRDIDLGLRLAEVSSIARL